MPIGINNMKFPTRFSIGIFKFILPVNRALIYVLIVLKGIIFDENLIYSVNGVFGSYPLELKNRIPNNIYP